MTRPAEGLPVIDYPMPQWVVAGYSSELNPLLPLEYCDQISGTPTAKPVPVRAVVAGPNLAAAG